jgi:hypothetical protein
MTLTKKYAPAASDGDWRLMMPGKDSDCGVMPDREYTAPERPGHGGADAQTAGPPLETAAVTQRHQALTDETRQKSRDERFWTRIQKDTEEIDHLLQQWAFCSNETPPHQLDRDYVKRISEWSEELVECAMRLQVTTRQWLMWQDRKAKLQARRKVHEREPHQGKRVRRFQKHVRGTQQYGR